MPKSNGGEHDCLCDLGPGETQTGFYHQGGRFKMWFSGSGKRRAYASIHIMKIRMFVIDAIFAKLLYTCSTMISMYMRSFVSVMM